MNRSALILGFLAFTLHPVSLAQDEPEKTISIRVEVDLVPIEVLALDKKGRPVLDLKQEDFLIFENSLPQKITHFSTIDYTQLELKERETKESGAPSSESSRFTGPGYRTFLIMLGRGRHTELQPIPALIRFVRDLSKKTDQIAVMSYNRATEFTADKEKIVRVLERYADVSAGLDQAISLRHSGVAAMFGQSLYNEEIQAKVNAIFEEEGLGTKQVYAREGAGESEASPDLQEMLFSSERAMMETLIDWRFVPTFHLTFMPKSAQRPTRTYSTCSPQLSTFVFWAGKSTFSTSPTKGCSGQGWRMNEAWLRWRAMPASEFTAFRPKVNSRDRITLPPIGQGELVK
jgi:hypothetical protein